MYNIKPQQKQFFAATPPPILSMAFYGLTAKALVGVRCHSMLASSLQRYPHRSCYSLACSNHYEGIICHAYQGLLHFFMRDIQGFNKKNEKLGLLPEPLLTPPTPTNLSPVIWFDNISIDLKHS